jgi:hypothetical protein
MTYTEALFFARFSSRSGKADFTPEDDAPAHYNRVGAFVFAGYWKSRW